MQYMEKYIERSKEKCRAWGLDPTAIPLLQSCELHFLEAKLQEYQEILEVVGFFVTKFLTAMKGTPVIIVVTDERGILLEVVGDDTIKSMMQQLGFKKGMLCTEEINGTNAVSLALEHKCPIRLVGTDHYHHFIQSSACFAVPFRHVETNEILGTITIMTTCGHANNLLLTLLTTVADAVERELILRRQYQKLNILNQITMDAAKTGIILINKDGIIIEFNNYAAKALRKERENLLGLPVQKLEVFGEYLINILFTRTTQEDIEVIMEDRAASRRVYLFDGMPIYDQEGRLTGAFGKFRDITERYRAEEKLGHMAHALAEVNQLLLSEISVRKSIEEQLKQKNQEIEDAYAELKTAQAQVVYQEKLASIGQLAAAVAHEIRNPMTTVRGYLQLMERRKEYQGDKQKLNLMMEEIDRANAIISEYLSLSREKIANLRSHSLNHIIEALFPLIQASATASHMYAKLQLGDIPALLLDENEIRQLLLNLVRNSIEAMNAGGELVIKTFQEPNKVVMTISDQGSGIPLHVLNNLGTPFITTKDTGTGLGLPICYQIVNRHNAEIDIKTSHQGTMFSISFTIGSETQ